MRPPTHLAIECLIREDQTAEVYFRIEGPSDVPEADASRSLDCDGPASRALAGLAPGLVDLDHDLVRSAGREVFEKLCRHPGVRQALGRAAHNEAFPIWVETRTEEAEQLPWEAMYDPQSNLFFALEEKWPIVRIAGRRSGESVVERLVDAPLRIGVVLAAAERPAEPEWAGVVAQLEDRSENVELRVWTSDQPVFDRIQNDQDPGVQVQWVPSSEDELITEIGNFKPHILHFFCHGSASYGGYLEVARRSTVQAGQEPLFLNARQIGRLCESTILVVLNVCEGASAAKEMHSLAYSLVNAGTPAVIGMREAVDAHDANLFSEHAVSEVLRNLDHGLNNHGRTKIDWSTVLSRPRREMCKRHHGPVGVTAAKCKAWTLPALYVRPEPLYVQFVPGRPAPDVATADGRDYLVSVLETLSAHRANLHPDTPAEKIASVDRAIEELRALLLDGDQVVEPGVNPVVIAGV